MAFTFGEPAEMPGMCDDCLRWTQTLIPFWRGAEFKMRCRPCRQWGDAIARARKETATL